MQWRVWRGKRLEDEPPGQKMCNILLRKSWEQLLIVPERLSNFTFTFHFHAFEKEMATHSMFFPGESQGWGSLVGCHLWGHAVTWLTQLSSSSSQKEWKGLVKMMFSLWRCLMVKIKSNAVRIVLPGMLGPWIKVNWTWSNRSSMTRGNIDILGISEWTWTGRENLIQITIIPTIEGKIPWGKMEYPLIVNKKSPKCRMYVWSWRLQNDLGSFPS